MHCNNNKKLGVNTRLYTRHWLQLFFFHIIRRPCFLMPAREAVRMSGGFFTHLLTQGAWQRGRGATRRTDLWSASPHLEDKS